MRASMMARAIVASALTIGGVVPLAAQPMSKVAEPAAVGESMMAFDIDRRDPLAAEPMRKVAESREMAGPTAIVEATAMAESTGVVESTAVFDIRVGSRTVASNSHIGRFIVQKRDLYKKEQAKIQDHYRHILESRLEELEVVEEIAEARKSLELGEGEEVYWLKRILDLQDSIGAQASLRGHISDKIAEIGQDTRIARSIRVEELLSGYQVDKVVEFELVSSILVAIWNDPVTSK